MKKPAKDTKPIAKEPTKKDVSKPATAKTGAATTTATTTTTTKETAKPAISEKKDVKPTHASKPSEQKLTQDKGKPTDTTISGSVTASTTNVVPVVNIEDSYSLEPKETDSTPKSTVAEAAPITPSSYKNINDEYGTKMKELEMTQLKKFNEEKKELSQHISMLKKERDEWKKKHDELDKANIAVMKELDDYSIQTEKVMTEKTQVNSKLQKLQQQNKELQGASDQHKKKIEELEGDVLLLKEELEATQMELELERQNTGKMKKAMGKDHPVNQVITSTSTSSSPELELKISQLESFIAELSINLNKATEERDFAAQYYQKEIDKFNERLASQKKLLGTLPEKDDVIRQLTDKLKDDEGVIEVLKTQINTLSPANNMYEQIIIEKDELETEIIELKQEKEKIREDLESEMEMVSDLESALKISEQMIRQSQDDLLKMKNTEKLYQAKIEEYEAREKSLVEKLGQVKNENKIIRNEVAKVRDINIDEVLNKNITTNSKIKTLERQKVLIGLTEIEMGKLNMRNKIVNKMIPQKIFQNGSMDSFEKFLNVQGLRKKTMSLIYNIIENDLLGDDLINPLGPTETKLDAIEEENNKTYIAFLRSVLQTLIDFSIALLNLEILVSGYDVDKFRQISVDSSSSPIWKNISAASQLIEILIGMIKEDSFGIKYQPQADGLKSIVKTISNEISLVSATEQACNNTLVTYHSQILNYLFNLILNFKHERFMVIQTGDTNNIQFAKLPEISKNLVQGYKHVKKCMKTIEEKMFVSIPYDKTGIIFDVQSSYFNKLCDNFRNIVINIDSFEALLPKYELLVDSMSKLSVVVMSYIERYEKDNLASPSSADARPLDANSDAMPLKTWIDISNVVCDELNSIAQMKEDLETTQTKLKQLKLEKADIESKYEELNRSKQANDQKLAEVIVKVGKIAQLESSKEELEKKIEKYKTTVESLVKSTDDESQKAKNYKTKYEELLKKQSEERRGSIKDKRMVIAGPGQPTHMLGLVPSGSIGDTMPLVNTICELQKERKYLKSKLMKDKLIGLFSDSSSFMNKYIEKSSKLTNYENEKDFYGTIEESVKNLNDKYDMVRKDLCLPTVQDLSKSDYNYENTQKREMNKVNKLRIDYMQDADRILNQMFGDHTLDKTFKDIIDNDISRTLKYYGEKRLLVGKITFSDEKSEKNKNDVPPKQTVPILMSESSLKMLNKTFMH